jgi:4-amino-4-deoxy-L-arabinose transferase-like glycosyltransferase
MLAGAALPHMDADDIFYGDIARDILACRDWLTLSHPDRPHWIVDKPPLSFWLMAASIRVGGDNQVALRLWQLALALVTMVVTLRLARLGGGREEALLAAVLLGTCLQFVYLSLNPKQDFPLSLFLALAFYSYLRYRSAGATASAVAAGWWMALALLSKGIVALAAFIPVVVLDLLIPREPGAGGATPPGFWRWPQVGAGAGAFLLAGAPWFVVGAMRQGRPFIDTFFLGGSLGVGRFFHGVFAPVSYPVAVVAMAPMLMVGLIPWTGFLPAAIREGWRSVRAGAPSVRVCALWAGWYFAMLSLSPGDKMVHHLLPMFVPAAVLLARAVVVADGLRRRLLTPAVIALAAAVPAAGFTVRAMSSYPTEAAFFRPLVLPLVGLAVTALVLFAVFALRGQARAAVAAAGAAMLLAYATSGGILMSYPSVPLGPSGIRAKSPSCVTKGSLRTQPPVDVRERAEREDGKHDRQRHHVLERDPRQDEQKPADDVLRGAPAPLGDRLKLGANLGELAAQRLLVIAQPA